ncbi:hypothetical protein N9769_08735, partial [Ascidiaceihabitans sp.]|nr:hypothetical protein [Ascidiaceihabitans sp.]
PVFLERRSYRQRRMMDAIRLLPLVGLLLWLLPTLWAATDSDGVEPVRMSQAIVYVFGVWVCLILSAGTLWRYLKGSDDDAGTTESAVKTDPK